MKVEEEEEDQRNSLVSPAVNKTVTTQGLIVTEISKPVVCSGGREVAAAPV